MTGTHYKSLLDTDYIGQWDFAIDPKTGKRREVTVIIAEKPVPYVPRVRRKKRMPDGKYQDEPIKRYVISLRNSKGAIRKKWLSGPVTQKTIADMYGPMLEDWVDKPITLYVDESVMMGRERVGGVRVKNTKPTSGPGDDNLDEKVDDAIRAAHDSAFGRDEDDEKPAS